ILPESHIQNQPDGHEEHHRGRAAVRDERQWDSGHWQQADLHRDVDEDVKDKKTDQRQDQKRSAAVSRCFGYGERLEDEEQVERQYHAYADEAPLFAEDGEDEIGVPRWQVLEVDLRAVQESF